MSANDKPTPVSRVLCRVLGHKWRTAWDGGAGAHGWPSLTCIRCHVNGWRSDS